MKLSFEESVKTGLLQRSFDIAVAKAAEQARAHKLPPAGIVSKPRAVRAPARERAAASSR